eukprot:CAMPEP_0204835314 /NCGR_PEP_ID=MMETSP1346-20131115/22247_1 /ASSEMBLY_ACC=CAM_ASM_000771 /TAXON_ID=215587 /ORGANISM="Aplanochytrium stocchinoi, Strain GSBS06" /LENGTH=74 /DNA_ID=CAMNT_0051969203 /DNA_START=522 /DNA_END=746 /DNA_ORIENTATION=-
MVHIEYTKVQGEQLVADVLGVDEAEIEKRIGTGTGTCRRYQILSFQRNIGDESIQQNTLAVADTSSISNEDIHR